MIDLEKICKELPGKEFIILLPKKEIDEFNESLVFSREYVVDNDKAPAHRLHATSVDLSGKIIHFIPIENFYDTTN